MWREDSEELNEKLVKNQKFNTQKHTKKKSRSCGEKGLYKINQRNLNNTERRKKDHIPGERERKRRKRGWLERG